MKNLRTFPVSAGLLDPCHVHAIGGALWVYLWFVNRVTRDEQRAGEDFVGIVLNGRPLSIDEIAEELGFDYHACRRHLARLVKTGYVERRKTGAGMFSYAVTKSKRWAWKRQTFGARNRPPSSSEKQANLFPPTEAPTEQKVLSGSEHPQSKICSQGADPQSGKCNSTEQKVLCGRKRTRARSHETTKTLTHTVPASEDSPALDEWVQKIAAEHPKLAYLKDTPLPQVYEYLIVEAIRRHGADRVLAGTRMMGHGVAQWAPEDQRFIPSPETFYGEKSQYLKTAAEWERPSKKQAGASLAAPPVRYGQASEDARRQRAAAGR